jgi:probable O-glycosylation ligase (exosortase A-associated)
MNQTILMVFTMAGGIFGSLAMGPFVAVLVYYFYAVLRPQYLWDWALPKFGWSYWVALAAIIATVVARSGVMNYATFGPYRGAKMPRWTMIHAFLGLFAIWQTLSYIFAVDHKVAYESWNECLKIFIFFFVASFGLTRVSHLWYLLIAITIADLFVAYEMNFQYFRFNRNDIQTNGFGGLDNNGAGLMLAMGLPLCYFLWEATKSWFRWVYILGIPVLGHAVMLSFSRGAMLSILVSMPILLMMSQRKKYVLGVYALGAVFVLATTGPELRERFNSIAEHEVDGSAQSRRKTWAAAIKLANSKPLFGYGIRCSTLFTQDLTNNGVEMQAIHNTYLQTAADSGWPAMVWFILLIGGSMYVAFRVWRQTSGWVKLPPVLHARAVGSGVIGALTIFSIGAIFLSLESFEMPYILVLVGAQLYAIHRGGGIEAAARDYLPPPPRPRPQLSYTPAAKIPLNAPWYSGTKSLPN